MNKNKMELAGKIPNRTAGGFQLPSACNKSCKEGTNTPSSSFKWKKKIVLEIFFGIWLVG